jgi:lipid-A-disaccharide synthase
MQPKIMMSALEVSADLHGSFLARQLKGCKLIGMGGEKMKAAGVDVRIDITEKSTVGIIEALKHIPSHLFVLAKMKKMLKDERPDALILIDAQGFNMPLASYAKSIGIRTIYYISPQEWLWGTKKGINKVANTIDLIISIFKKEHEAYLSAGGNSVYFGHPLLDIAKPSLTKEQFFAKYGLNHKEKVIALCPGSRQHELKSIFPIIIEAAKKLAPAQFLIPVSSSRFREVIKKHAGRSGLNVKIIEGPSYDVIAHSDLVIAKSGTVVLESVCLDTPVIMLYKLSPLTYYIAKNIMKIDLPFYSMPNILVNRLVVPEFVMKDADPNNIYDSAVKILKDTQKARKGYAEVRQTLGNPGAIEKAAQKIIEFAGSK